MVHERLTAPVESSDSSPEIEVSEPTQEEDEDEEKALA